MSGRIVADGSALGTIDTDACPGTRWAAVETVSLSSVTPATAARRSGVILVLAAHLGLQPGLGQPPVPHHGIGRYLQDGRGFLHAQPTKEPKLDDAALPLVELRERLQRVVERDKVLTGSAVTTSAFVEGHACVAAAAFVRAPCARMVHEDATHDAGGDGQEMRAVVPLDRLAVDQANIRLVDERRRLEAMTHALSRHAASRDPVEFLMDERDQSLEGALVALSPFEEQPGDVRVGIRNPGILGPFARLTSFVQPERARRQFDSRAVHA